MRTPSRGTLPGLNLNLLVALDALVAERSVGVAARRVGLSPSAMSHALARLREHFGDPILVRTARGMVPTARALGLMAALGPALRQVEAALDRVDAFEPARAEGVVRVAAIDLTQLVLVPPLLERLSADAPRVHLQVLPYGENVASALAEGAVDLALGLRRDLPTLRQRPLLTDRYVCVVRRGHPCRRGPLTPEAYSRLAHALVTPRRAARGAMDSVLSAEGLERRVTFSTNSTVVAMLAVAGSDRVLTVAERVALLFAKTFALEIVEPPLQPPPLKITLAWHERTAGDPLLSWVRDQVASAADGLRPPPRPAARAVES